MNKKIWKLITLAVMLLIFWFSSRNGAESSLQSDWVQLFLHAPIFVIRKMAHASIYALLALCIYMAQTHPKFKTTMIIVILYASSDEFHQYFVPGRSARVYDVVIDTLGALAMWTIIQTIRKRRIHES